MFTPQGTNLTWTGYFDPLSFYNQTAVDACALVGNNLKNKYNLIVTNINKGTGNGDFSSGSITFDMITQMDRGSEEDIRGNVQDEFALIGCACIDSDIAVAGVSNPTGASPQATGSATQVRDPGFDCTTFGDRVQNLLPTWLGGSPVTPAQQACRTQAEKTQVGNVGIRAVDAYGVNSPAALAAQTAVASNQVQAAADQTGLADAARKAAASHDNTMLYIGIGIAAVVVAVVAMPYAMAASR